MTPRLLLVCLSLASCGGMPATKNSVADGPTNSEVTVRIVEPFGVGGGPDLLARALAPRLAEIWGRPVIVENRTGAGATAGPAEVAKSAPDGNTLLMNTSAQAYAAALSKNLPYDPLQDFVPVAALTTQPYVLVCGRNAGVSSLADLLAAAKAAPGQLRFASTGPGTGTHLAAVKFNREAGIAAVDVPPDPTAGIAGVLTGTIEGRTTYMFAPISAVTLPLIRDGGLIALGVSTLNRSSLLPDVPTIAEAGVAAFDFPIWYGLWAPAGTPPALLEQLGQDIDRVIDEPDLRAWLVTHGAYRMRMTQPEFSQFVHDESASAVRLLATTNATPQ